jgi:formamidopyrimidine-DNA glycosylase
MPELPEVETTRRGIEPYLLDQQIRRIDIRNRQLRWPVSPRLQAEACKARIHSVGRRAKYLLINTDRGCIIIHLGMSGSLRMVDTGMAAEKHDHIDIVLSNDKVLRFRDPRRFGAFLWTRANPLLHKRLAGLGPEPLQDNFDSAYMLGIARGRKQAIKPFIMNSQIVVGVGNIYACESLFLAGINPKTAAGRLSPARWLKLVAAIKSVLNDAINQGGTTLRDFSGSDGQPGYFAQSLNVYGREGEACVRCQRPVRKITQAQRSTFYCSHCQR